MTILLSIFEGMHTIHGLPETLRWINILIILQLIIRPPLGIVYIFEIHCLPQLRILTWYFFYIFEMIIGKCLICTIFQIIFGFIVWINEGKLIRAFFKIDG